MKVKLNKLNNYERGIIFSIIHNVGAYSFSGSFGRTAVFFKRKKRIIKYYIIYKMIFSKHKKEIYSYFYQAIVDKKHFKTFQRFKSFQQIISFPIRPSWYYAEKLGFSLIKDKNGNYWSPGVFTNVRVSLKRLLSHLEDNYDDLPDWYKVFVLLLYFIALDGKVYNRGGLKQWAKKAETRLKVLLDKRLLI